MLLCGSTDLSIRSGDRLLLRPRPARTGVLAAVLPSAAGLGHCGNRTGSDAGHQRQGGQCGAQCGGHSDQSRDEECV